MSNQTYVQPSAARKAELEETIKLLWQKGFDAIDQRERDDIAQKLKKAMDEYELYYND